MTLDEIFDKMPEALNTEAAAGMDVVVQFNCSNPRYLTIKDGSCAVTPGTADDFRVAVTMQDDDMRDLLTGELDGMTAFMTGKVQLDGDMMFAQQLGSLFKPGNFS